MATANEIESYGGDKNLAFGSTALPAASTDAIVDSNPAVAYWNQYANNKLTVARENLVELKRRQLQSQKDLQDALTAPKVWQAHNQWFTKKWDEFSKLAVEVGRKGNWENLNDPDYLKAAQMLNDIQKGAQYSMQQKALYDTTNDIYQKDPSKWVDGDKSLGDYYKIGDPIKTADANLDLTPNITFDFDAYATKLKGSLAPSAKQVVTSRMVNGRWEDTTETIYDPDKIRESVKVDYQTNKKLQASMDDAFRELAIADPATAQQYGNAEEYAAQVAINKMTGGNKMQMKNPFFSPYDRAKANAITIPMSETVDIVSVDPHQQLPLMSLETFKAKHPELSGDKLQAEYNRQKPVISKDEFKALHPELSDKEVAKQYANATQRTPNKVVLSNGHYIAKSGLTPSGNLSGAPDWAIDPATGLGLSPQEIGTQTWNIEIVNDGYIARKKRQDGKYDYYSTEQAPKDAELVRGAQVVRNSDKKTFIIPYDESIDAILKNNPTPIILEDNKPQSNTQQDNQQPEQTQQFIVKGVTYNIPLSKVAAFKKAKGIQ